MLLYEIKVNYQRQTGEDNPGNVRETYLVEGMTPGDVEERLLNAIRPLIFGEFEMQSCTKKQFFEILNSGKGDKWYKGRVELITIEDNGKETRKTVSVLIEAGNAKTALETLTQAMNSYDCEIVSIARTPILEVMRAVN